MFFSIPICTPQYAKELYMIWVKFGAYNSLFFYCFRYIKLLCYILEILILDIYFSNFNDFFFNSLAVYDVRSYAFLKIQSKSIKTNTSFFFRMWNIERHFETLNKDIFCHLIVLNKHIFVKNSLFKHAFKVFWK